jgi:hypothetical protein
VEIDISTSDEMVEKYGTRIPVLGAGDKLTELNWPFTSDQVDSFFAELIK